MRAPALMMPDCGRNPRLEPSAHPLSEDHLADEAFDIARCFERADLVCTMVEPHTFHPSRDSSPPFCTGRLKGCAGTGKGISSLVVRRSRGVHRALCVAYSSLGGLDGSDRRFNGLDILEPLSSCGAQC